MKKSIFMLAIIAGAVLIGCKSNAEKEADAVENVVVAEQDLETVKENVDKDEASKVNDAEWQMYKDEANKTIAENETRIAELQTAMNKKGTTFDDSYKKSISDIDDRNKALKTKIANYENNRSDWASFKREFNSDMTDLGDAFKNLTVNNKK